MRKIIVTVALALLAACGTTGPASQPPTAAPAPAPTAEPPTAAPAPAPTAEPPAASPGASPAPEEEATLDEAGRQIVDLAKQALAAELGSAVDQIALVQIEPVEWRDSSLGCPKEGVMYMQVITPGYRVVLEAGGQQYEYHTDTRRQVVRCDAP